MSVLSLSLAGGEAKRVARLLSSDSARRVMDAVADESKSESVLADELGMPLSTVHYNVQRLFEAGLLVSDEFTYSEKGKEVRHYRLASDHIVISTRPSVPVAELVTGGTFALMFAAGYALLIGSDSPLQASSRMATDSMMEAAPMAASAAAQSPAVWPWILAGALAVLVGAFVAWFVRR